MSVPYTSYLGLSSARPGRDRFTHMRTVMATARATWCVAMAFILAFFLVVLAAKGEPGMDAARLGDMADCMVGCGIDAAQCGMKVAECALGCVTGAVPPIYAAPCSTTADGDATSCLACSAAHMYCSLQ
jgi:hypothetical protein